LLIVDVIVLSLRGCFECAGVQRLVCFLGRGMFLRSSVVSGPSAALFAIAGHADAVEGHHCPPLRGRMRRGVHQVCECDGFGALLVV